MILTLFIFREKCTILYSLLKSKIFPSVRCRNYLRRSQILSAMCRGENVFVRDETSTAERFVKTLLDERHLPRKLVPDDLLTADDSVIDVYAVADNGVGFIVVDIVVNVDLVRNSAFAIV